MDKDKNGYLDKTEAASATGMDFSSADTNNDGRISRSEFESAMKKGGGSSSSGSSGSSSSPSSSGGSSSGSMGSGSSGSSGSSSGGSTSGGSSGGTR
ncbi:MAG: hypothetical protein ACJ8J7_14955 [Sulfurifustaceae bacterium]